MFIMLNLSISQLKYLNITPNQAIPIVSSSLIKCKTFSYLCMWRLTERDMSMTFISMIIY